MAIVLASHNIHKCQELRALCPEITWVTLSDYAGDPPEETGVTFLENALIKARAASHLTGLPALADDSGLVVPALKGDPGVYSARYAGVGASDHDNLSKLLSVMHNKKEKFERAAYYVAVLVFVKHPDDPMPIVAEGIWSGEIAEKPKGDQGFGYDPIFWLPDLQKTVAQLSFEEKLTHSHRTQALMEFKRKWRWMSHESQQDHQ